MLPMWLTIPAAMLVAGLIGFLISFPVLRTRGVYMVLATFAFGEVVAGFLLRYAVLRRRHRHGRAGARGDCRSLLCCAVAVTLLDVLSDGNPVRPRHALDQRRRSAATVLMGVNVRAVQVAAFTIGGAFAGLSGALYAHNFSFVEAQYFNSFLSIYVLLFVLIGGVANRLGTAGRHLVFHAVAGDACASADHGAMWFSASPSC